MGAWDGGTDGRRVATVDRLLRFYTIHYLCWASQHGVPGYLRNPNIISPPRKAFSEPGTSAKIQIIELSISLKPLLHTGLWTHTSGPSHLTCWDGGCFALRSLTQPEPHHLTPGFFFLDPPLSRKTAGLPHTHTSFPGALPCLAASNQKQTGFGGFAFCTVVPAVQKAPSMISLGLL